MSRLITFVLIWICAFSVVGETVKCVAADGSVSYQDRPCSEKESPARINGQYVNELPLGPSPEARKVFSAIAREREAKEAQHVRQRNEAIREYTRRYEKKKALCRQYKEDYAAFLRFKRRNGNPAGDHESDLIRRMRRACSG